MATKKTMTDAYFSSTFLNNLEPFDREIFPIASIAYDTIYVDKDLKKLSWEWATCFRNDLDSINLSTNHGKLKKGVNLSGIAFANVALLNSLMFTVYSNKNKELLNTQVDNKVSGKDFLDVIASSKPTTKTPTVTTPTMGPSLMGSLSSEAGKKLGEKLTGIPIADGAGNALTAYLDWDIAAYQEFLNGDKLRYIRESNNEEIQEFFYLNFEQVMKNQNATPIFHNGLLKILAYYYSIINGSDILQDAFTRAHLIIMIQEFFVTYFLSAKHGISPILTTSEIELRMAIKSLPPIPMQQNNQDRPLLFRKYCDLETIQDMLSFRNAQHEEIQPIIELSVPRFSDIPLVEIAKLKKKDNFSSIAKLSESLKEKRRITGLDFSKIFVDELWQMGKRLSPSIAENIIGVLGELPLPIPLNPISILSSANSIKNLINFKKEYGWFIVLSKLQDLSNRKSRNKK